MTTEIGENSNLFYNPEEKLGVGVMLHEYLDIFYADGLDLGNIKNGEYSKTIDGIKVTAIDDEDEDSAVDEMWIEGGLFKIRAINDSLFENDEAFETIILTQESSDGTIYTASYESSNDNMTFDIIRSSINNPNTWSFLGKILPPIKGWVDGSRTGIEYAIINSHVAEDIRYENGFDNYTKYSVTFDENGNKKEVEKLTEGIIDGPFYPRSPLGSPLHLFTIMRIVLDPRILSDNS